MTIRKKFEALIRAHKNFPLISSKFYLFLSNHGELYKLTVISVKLTKFYYNIKLTKFYYNKTGWGGGLYVGAQSFPLLLTFNFSNSFLFQLEKPQLSHSKKKYVESFFKY